MNVVAVITARGGSQGLPRKNVLPLAGKPLIAHTIIAAQEAKLVGRIIVSSDDKEICSVAKKYGAEIPFVRPAELATADAAHIDVVLHALDWLQSNGDIPDAILLLQPTSPLRSAEDIDGAIQLMISTGCPAVVGVCPVETHPYLTYKMDDFGRLSSFIDHGLRYPRRQDLPPAYTLNGALYLNNCSSLRDTHAFQPPGTLGWIMSKQRSMDIDTREDFLVVENVLLGLGSEASCD